MTMGTNAYRNGRDLYIDGVLVTTCADEVEAEMALIRLEGLGFYVQAVLLRNPNRGDADDDNRA